MGATASLDPVQLTQMAKHLETVYVSGWQSSSTASSSLEPGPDLAGASRRPRLLPTSPDPRRVRIDYPSNTVPLKVAQLFTAQLFHDRKQRFHRAQAGPEGRKKMGKPIDYLRPIVADADTVRWPGGRGGGCKADGMRCDAMRGATTGTRRADGRHEARQDDGRGGSSGDSHRGPGA